MVEYILLVSLIAIACIFALRCYQNSFAKDCGNGKVGQKSLVGRTQYELDHSGDAVNEMGNQTDSNGCPANTDDEGL